MLGQRWVLGLWIVLGLGMLGLPACASETDAPNTSGTPEIVAPRATVLVVATPVPTRTPQPRANTVVIGSSPMTSKHYNPIWLASAPQFLTLPLILPALTWFNDKAQPVLDLAAKVEVAPNAMTYTFTLPKEATWSDGTPLTSKDVAFTYKLALDPALGSALWATNLASIKGALDYQRGVAKDIEGIKIVDDQTIRFELREANAVFLFNTYLGILPAHILGKVEAKEIDKHAYLDAPTVTAGPYEFVKYDPGQVIQLKKRANYWGKAAKLDQVLVRLFETSPAMLAALEAGDIHVAALPASEAERLRKQAQLNVLSAKGVNAQMLYIDARTRDQIAALNRTKEQGGRGYAILRAPKPYLADKRFRQALDYALDQKTLIQTALSGEAVAIASPLLAPDWAINPNLNKYELNVDRAKVLLTEAGIKFDAQGNALYENRPIALVYLASAGDDARKLGEAVQQQLAKIGIRVDTKLVADSAFLSAALNGEGDLIRGVAPRVGADPSVAALYFTCKAGWAELVLGYCNVKFDDAMAKGAAASKAEDRQKFYWDASLVLNEDLPGVFLFAPNTLIGAPKDLSGIKPVADPNHLTWNLSEWAFPQ